MQFRFLIFVLAMTFSLSALAQDLPLKISGNKRTRDSYIKLLYRDCVENNKTKKPSVIQQCLLNSRLFSEVTVKREKEEIQITVDERWTLIPIPFARTDEKNRQFGVFLLEQNLFGTGKMILIGGALGNRSDLALLTFRNPNLGSSDFFMWGSTVWKNEEIYRYDGQEEVRAHFLQSREATLVTGYRKQFWKFGAGLKVYEYTFKKVDDFPVPSEGTYDLALNLSTSYFKTNYRLYYDEGFSAQLDLDLEFLQEQPGSLSQRLLSKITWQKNTFWDHSLKINWRTEIAFDAGTEDIIYLGGGTGFRGVLNSGIWAKRSSSIAVDYQIPFVKAGYGTWTLSPFAEYGHYESFFAGNNSDSYSYGVGAYLYMREIALPGLGVIVARNPNFEKFFISAFVGRSF